MRPPRRQIAAVHPSPHRRSPPNAATSGRKVAVGNLEAPPRELVHGRVKQGEARRKKRISGVGSHFFRHASFGRRLAYSSSVLQGTGEDMAREVISTALADSSGRYVSSLDRQRQSRGNGRLGVKNSRNGTSMSKRLESVALQGTGASLKFPKSARRNLAHPAHASRPTTRTPSSIG